MIKVKFELNGNLHTLGEYDNETNKFTFKKDKYTPYNIWNELKNSLLNYESGEIMVNSKQKGNNFERKVAKILTEKLGMEFNRVPQSGGLRWASDNNVYGDIVTPEDFPFIIECKNRENWSFDQLMKGECKEFDSWIEQVEGDCNRYNKNNKEKLPLIIFTKNRMPIYISCPAYINYVDDYTQYSCIEKLVSRETVAMQYKDWFINKLEG